MCVDVLSVYTCICTLVKVTWSYEDTVIEGCESLCGYWGLNSSPLKEQLVLLTAELSSALCTVFKKESCQFVRLTE